MVESQTGRKIQNLRSRKTGFKVKQETDPWKNTPAFKEEEEEEEEVEGEKWK